VYLAYGISILCTLICVVSGCLALLHNGLSYTANFSTILRTTRRADITSLVDPNDTFGGAPLPKVIADAVVRYDVAEGEERYAVHGFRIVRDDVGMKSLERGDAGNSSEATVQEEEDPVERDSEIERPEERGQPLDRVDCTPRVMREYLGRDEVDWSQENVSLSSHLDQTL